LNLCFRMASLTVHYVKSRHECKDCLRKESGLIGIASKCLGIEAYIGSSHKFYHPKCFFERVMSHDILDKLPYKNACGMDGYKVLTDSDKLMIYALFAQATDDGVDEEEDEERIQKAKERKRSAAESRSKSKGDENEEEGSKEDEKTKMTEEDEEDDDVSPKKRQRIEKGKKKAVKEKEEDSSRSSKSSSREVQKKERKETNERKEKRMTTKTRVAMKNEKKKEKEEDNDIEIPREEKKPTKAELLKQTLADKKREKEEVPITQKKKIPIGQDGKGAPSAKMAAFFKKVFKRDIHEQKDLDLDSDDE
ncbi:hypothetical protein PFISCL1PPCAC_6156, partial [Pristionchus fissidentatus]